MEKNFVAKIGHRIRDLRKAQGLTQEKLAELCQISYKYLGEIERGSINPGVSNLAQIAHGLSVELKEIVDVDLVQRTDENAIIDQIAGMLVGKDKEELEKARAILKVLFR